MSTDPLGKVIVILPALNEQVSIVTVVQGVTRYGQALVVDDCSDDATGSLAKEAGAHVVRLDPGRGYEGALEAGFAEADRLGADTVVTFDADGQFHANSIPDVLWPIRDGEADLVLGERPEMARIGEVVFGLYTKTRFKVSDILCGVKAYRMSLYREHGRFGHGGSVGTELALASIRRGAAFARVPVAVRERAHGAPRFGASYRANAKILFALLLSIWRDIRSIGTKAT